MSNFWAFLKREFNPVLSAWIKPTSYLFIGCLIAAILALKWVEAIKSDSPLSSYQPVIAKPSKVVKNVPQIDVVVKKPVKVYKNGAALKNGLKLPQEVVKDDNIQILSSNTTANDDHPHTLTTTINTETGESETYDKKEPLPWIALDARGSLGIYYGIKSTGTVARLEAKQDVFDVKNIRCGGVASVDTDASYFAGIGCAITWP